MIFNEYFFAFKFENRYYYMRHLNDFTIKTKADAYKVINEQGHFEVNIWSFKEIKEGAESGRAGSDSEELYNALKQLIREDKLKSLAKDE